MMVVVLKINKTEKMAPLNFYFYFSNPKYIFIREVPDTMPAATGR